MHIENLADLCRWAAQTAAAAGCDPGCVESVAAVVWRHAHSQGLRAGEDWGWILAQYDAAAVREIAAAAADAGEGDRSRRRQRGF